MSKYKVEWYIDEPGMDGVREAEIEAENGEEARKEVFELLYSRLTIGEVNKVK